MHRPDYIKLINAAAAPLGITTEHLSDNWAIRLSKDGVTRFIVGNTFPLNDSPCYKIVGNKNLCSDILTASKIANVPHQVLFSPSVLVRRHSNKGNSEIIARFIRENGFPVLVKRNNSSKGEGVYLVGSEAELENVLSKIYVADSSLCLSPYRENIREYRNIILDGKCLLSYEKRRPFVIGDGKSSMLALLSEFAHSKVGNGEKLGKLFDALVKDRMIYVPRDKEEVFLHWKHNRFPGTTYETVSCPEMEQLAIAAADAVAARFTSVDIIRSEKHGYEVLEMSASVIIHYPMIYSKTATKYEGAVGIYQAALNAIFPPK